MVLAKRLAAAGFEHEDIDDALGWLYGLAETTERCVDLAHQPATGTSASTPIANTPAEHRGHRFHHLPGVRRSIARAPARKSSSIAWPGGARVARPLSKLKITALMVLWSREADIDNLVLEELLDDDGDVRCLH